MTWKGESRRHSLARKGIKTAKGTVKFPRKIPSYVSYIEELTNEETEQFQHWKKKLIEYMDDDVILNSYELAHHITELENSGELTHRVADILYDILHFKANDKKKEFEKQIKEKTSDKNFITPISKFKKSMTLSKSKQIEYTKQAGKYDPDSLFYNPDYED